MHVFTNRLSLAITLVIVAAMLVRRPILQPVGYYDCADHSTWLAIPHAADVYSDLGFALVVVLAALGCISGHTLKHLRATVAAAVIMLRLARRTTGTTTASVPAIPRAQLARA